MVTQRRNENNVINTRYIKVLVQCIELNFDKLLIGCLSALHTYVTVHVCCPLTWTAHLQCFISGSHLSTRSNYEYVKCIRCKAICHVS